MLRLKSIRIQNFMSFLDSTINLDKVGLVLIEGVNKDDPSMDSNGSGKSSVPDALRWCLYETTSRGHIADEVVRTYMVYDAETGTDVPTMCDNCIVTTEVEDAKGDLYTVRRARRAGRKSSGLFVECNGAPVDAGKGEMQALVNRLIGMGDSTFTNTVVFGQSAAYRFSALTDGQQKAILDEALGTEIYARACQLARDEAASVAAEQGAVLAQQNSAGTKLEEARARAEEYEGKEASFAEERKAAIKKAALRYKQAKAAHKEAEEKADTKDAVEDLYSSLCIAQKEAEEKAAECTNAANRTKLLRAGARERQREIEAHIAEVEAKEAGNCDACGQEVSEKGLKRHLKKLADSLEPWRVRDAEYEATYQRQSKEATAATEAAAEAKRTAETHRTKWVEPVRKVVALVKTLKQQRKEAWETMRQTQKQKSPYADMLAREMKSIAKLEAQLQKIQEELETVAAKIEQYQFWIDAFGTKGLRAFLIDSALPKLNERVAEYAEKLTDGNISISFTTQKTLKSGKTAESFEVTVVNKHGAPTYKGNSTGEKSKIDLCVGLAMQGQTRINVAFFDEPFESLDVTAMDRVVSLLTDTLRTRESVFVITHQDALKIHFPTTLTVVKEDGQSRIE